MWYISSMENTKKIIAIVANIGAGKSFVSSYITAQHGAESIRSSRKLLDILNILHLEPARKNFADLSETLRNTFGQDVLGNATFEYVKQSASEIILIDGVRRMADISNFTDEENFYLVFIDTSLEMRSERMTSRSEKNDDKNMNVEILNKDEQHDSENRVDGLKEKADFIVDNNGTLEQLKKNIDNVMEKILKS